MGLKILTNNPLFKEKALGNVEYFPFSSLEILQTSRDRVHLGYKLLSHPLTAALKSASLPYKTILLSDQPGPLDFLSLSLIEEALEFYRGNTASLEAEEEELVQEYMTTDWLIMKEAIENMDVSFVE